MLCVFNKYPRLLSHYVSKVATTYLRLLCVFTTYLRLFSHYVPTVAVRIHQVSKVAQSAGSYLRLIDFVYHSTLGLRVIKERREKVA